MSRIVDGGDAERRVSGAESASLSAHAAGNTEARASSALTVMDASEIVRVVRRLAHEIDERNDSPALALIGVLRRGAALSQRLRALLAELGRSDISAGTLDISLYRDDGKGVGGDPLLLGRTIPFSLTGRTVILVDDVLYTGRTARAALQALADLGRPRSVQLAVLIDRGERQLPIRADYVGKNVSAGANQRVYVRVAEVDGIDAVIVGPDNK